MALFARGVVDPLPLTSKPDHHARALLNRSGPRCRRGSSAAQPDRPSNSILVDSACFHASTLRLGRYTRRLRPTGMVNVSISSTPSPLANGSATQAPIFSVRR